MRHDVFVYLSGPMTAKDGHTLAENIAAGVQVYLECVQRGIPAFCPHLSGALATDAMTWQQWLDHDLAVIAYCTHVLTLPRWEDSAGARMEVQYAHDHGVPVIASLDELP